jgi:hypothetical protein
MALRSFKGLPSSSEADNRCPHLEKEKINLLFSHVRYGIVEGTKEGRCAVE